jgi:hypothetical protein
MQNKPNFPEVQMNISPVITKPYGNFHLLARRKNKANSNPIKPNFRPGGFGLRLKKCVQSTLMAAKNKYMNNKGVLWGAINSNT